MPTIFYEIFKKHIDLNAKNIHKFKEGLDELFKELAHKADIDNLKVTRNKLERLLHEKEKKSSKKEKKSLLPLHSVLEEINDFIDNKENDEAKDSKLIDVVKKVEDRYRSCKNLKEDKREKYAQVCVKKETISYEKEIIKLQVELLKLQKHIKEKGEKLLIIFEGRDAAGKGGTIKRFREYLNARGAGVVALEKPSDVEKTQWYFQRYVKHLPAGGEMKFFDRSWYNRAGVEPVMGFVAEEDYKKFLEDVPKFEKMLIDSGIKLVKFYFSVGKSEQAKRFESRRINPLKQYKLSPIDQYSQQLWDKYTLAEYNNFSATHNKTTPWTLIKSDNKKKARINAIKHVLNQFDYPKKLSDKELKVDPKIVYDGKEKVRRLSEEIDIKGDLFS